MPAKRVCNVVDCPELTDRGRCDEHQRQADQARAATPHQLGYGRQHRNRFRRAVLAADPTCVICRHVPATVADHHPVDRRELVRRGLDPNDPRYGRGLCASCHGKHTAAAQPGGWNNRD